MPSPDVNPMADRPLDPTFRPAPRENPAHAEGTFTHVLEGQTAKLPSSVFLALALGAMAASAGLELAGQTRLSRFVGMWPPTLLAMGIYNKLVKSLGTS